MTYLDEAELRANYRDPSTFVLDKDIDHIDEGAAGFLAATTLAVVATSGDEGNDASPRGGPPGFLTVLDEHRVAFGDLAGNNRLDTYGNIANHPSVGILCIVPGVEETLRINGRAHCGKALRRAGVWKPETWPADGARPSPAAIITGHLDLEIDPDLVAADLESDYEQTLWERGGS